MAITNWMLETPPRFCQLRLYKSIDEGMMACWATVAEMIVKWKSNDSYFVRPRFENILPRGNDFDAKIKYLLFIEEWLSSWGFETQNNGWYGTWSAETLATLLKDKGPLLCIGDFGTGHTNPLTIGGPSHAIGVYGYTQQFGGVHYVDPWDSDTGLMGLAQFHQKLWQSNRSVYARKPNYRRDPADGKTEG